MERSKGAVEFEEAIEKRGLTYRQVEKLIEVAEDSGQVTRLVNGDRLPGRDLSHRIWKEFGVAMNSWLEPAARRKAS